MLDELLAVYLFDFFGTYHLISHEQTKRNGVGIVSRKLLVVGFGEQQLAPILGEVRRTG